jgi:hypothetical protein
METTRLAGGGDCCVEASAMMAPCENPMSVVPAGAVTSAQLTTSTGDETLDGLFGTVAAQMKVDPPRDMEGRSEITGRMRMGYSCSPSAAVATIQLVP